ncbi:hypothetical protein HHJ79_11620 [Mobiluncus mulieris]|nr:hypothetical protein [Mobiluncus mulieris]
MEKGLSGFEKPGLSIESTRSSVKESQVCFLRVSGGCRQRYFSPDQVEGAGELCRAPGAWMLDDEEKGIRKELGGVKQNPPPGKGWGIA